MAPLLLHGRECYRLPIHSPVTDLTARELYFEVAGTDIRSALLPDPDVEGGVYVFLTLDEVHTVPTTETQFVVVDETNGIQNSENLLAGTLYRVAFV